MNWLTVKKIAPDLFYVLTGRWYELWISGHGSKFVRERGRYTKEEALKEANDWIGNACTIGGDAEVRNRYTGKVILQPWQKPKEKMPVDEYLRWKLSRAIYTVGNSINKLALKVR